MFRSNLTIAVSTLLFAGCSGESADTGVAPVAAPDAAPAVAAAVPADIVVIAVIGRNGGDEVGLFTLEGN